VAKGRTIAKLSYMMIARNPWIAQQEPDTPAPEPADPATPQQPVVPDPYPVSDPIPEPNPQPEPFPAPPEPIPQFPPDVTF